MDTESPAELLSDEERDTLRDAADVLRKLARNPKLIPPDMTHLTVMAADLEREADRR